MLVYQRVVVVFFHIMAWFFWYEPSSICYITTHFLLLGNNEKNIGMSGLVRFHVPMFLKA